MTDEIHECPRARDRPMTVPTRPYTLWSVTHCESRSHCGAPGRNGDVATSPVPAFQPSNGEVIQANPSRENPGRFSLSVARRNRTLIGACDRTRLRRLGSARAVKAIGHQFVCLIYAMLTRGQDFIERGVAHFESERSRERQLTSPSTPSTTIQPRPRAGRARRLMHKSTTSHSQTGTGCYM